MGEGTSALAPSGGGMASPAGDVQVLEDALQPMVRDLWHTKHTLLRFPDVYTLQTPRVAAVLPELQSPLHHQRMDVLTSRAALLSSANPLQNCTPANSPR